MPETTPTQSHLLAAETTNPSKSNDCSTDENDDNVKNLGWNDDITHAQVFIEPLHNEDIWLLVRRFNKQIFHVKSIKSRPLADLDFNIAAGEDISPEKLRAHLERGYMTVVTALVASYQHVIRVQSWREWKRTLLFFSVYALAWGFDILAMAMTIFIMVLIVFPHMRSLCFPPAPLSIISHDASLQKPLAGELATVDSVTGAREKHKGEAVEQEAHNFVKSISKLMMSISSGQYSQDNDGSEGSDIGPDPSQMAQDIADSRDVVEGHTPDEEYGNTRKPVAQIVESFPTLPMIHVLPSFIDDWERLANALNPTPPFPKHRAKLALASCFLPVLVVSYLATAYAVMKSVGFIIGFVVFGKPVINHGFYLADTIYPTWREFTNLRNTILRGVPTNAQLTIRLLRIGECNNSPLPPPPSDDEPPSQNTNVTAQDLEHLGSSKEEINTALEPQSDTDSQDSTDEKQNMTHRIGERIKKTAKGSIRAILKLHEAKDHLTKPPSRGFNIDSLPHTAGPVRFAARYRGKRGCVHVTTSATTPAVSWISEGGNLDTAWSVAMGSITEVKKVDSMGWKSKILVGWAMDKEVADGLVVRTGEGEYYLSGVGGRDELFNRVVGVGGQMWEVW